MQPLRIRAWLANGYATKDPWSPAIDGIIAAVVMRDRLGPEMFASPVPSELRPVEGLPLKVERRGDLWWYLASSPIVVGFSGRERKHFHRRFDDGKERHLADGIKRVMTAAGPYKASRLHDTRVICRALDWHVVGDEDAIRPILDRVTQVGARRGIGYGMVRQWEVGPGDADLARRHRPLPAEMGGDDAMIMPWGLVPPVRASTIECAMPEARHADA